MTRTRPAFALCLFLVAPAFAQETANRTGVNDSMFLAAAADSGQAEVSLSRLGTKRATDPDLKSFSEDMIKDHDRINQELRTLAGKKSVTISKVVDPRAQFCAESLAGLSGEKFDKCYAKAQLTAHMEAVAAFEAESERGLDREVKAFAAKNLPRIRHHLERIKPIAAKYEHEEREDDDKDSSDNK